MTDLFDVAVPDAELEAPQWEAMPTSAYKTTLQPGSALADNSAKGGVWKAIRVPFSGFTDTKSGKEFARSMNAQFTYENPNSEKSVQIGFASIVGMASALGLTEPTTTNDGKPGQKLTARDMDELVDQLNQMAGTEVEVYVTAGPRKRNGQIVKKNDGSDFVDNEIKNVRAAK